MQIENVFQACMKLPAPVLTVFLNTSESNPSRHPRLPTHLAWFLDNVETLRSKLAHPDAKQFDRQANRVRRFLETRHPAERAILIIAGPKTWQVAPLHVPVSNALHWGKPKIDPLLPLLNGHRRYGVVVMDHKAARYFEHAQGELSLLATKRFAIDASQWKRKAQGRVATGRLQRSRGPLRDLYERRIEAQYQRLCHQVASQTVALSMKNGFDGVFLVGPDRLIETVRERIPQPLADSTVPVRENLGRSSLKELQSRLEPLVDSYEQEQQLSLVKLLRASGHAAVTNPDEVLAQLQTGRIRALIVARDLAFGLRQCPKCGFASTAADPNCADCGSVRTEITLDELLAREFSTQNVKIEFVRGDAAQLLRQTGGLGGWLRAERAAAAG